MNNPNVKIYLTNKEETIYYTAGEQNPDGSWGLLPTAAEIPIRNIPIDWDKIKITYQRNTSYWGVFRSQSQLFTFVEDARFILMRLFYINGGGVQAECIMRIDVFIDVNIGYQTAYKSEIDFSKVDDGKYNSGNSNPPRLQGEFQVSTLDCKLYELLKSRGSTQINIPVWKNTGTTGSPIWELDRAEFIMHSGIKLLYNAQYTSSANLDNPLWYTIAPVGTSPGSRQLNGWNRGAIGDGYHIIPCMNSYNIVQNNGTTTFIGNDILQPFLLQKDQVCGAANFGSEASFSDANHSQPYTRENYSIKNLLDNETQTLDMHVAVSGSFNTTTIPLAANMTIDFPASTNPYFSFVLFEIDNTNHPEIVGGRYVNPIEILKIPLAMPSGAVHADIYIPNFDNTENPSPVTLRYDRVYIFGFICDTDAGLGSAMSCSFGFGDLKLFIKSKYDSGISGVPINAPKLNASVFPAFKIYDLFKRIVPLLETNTTDGYGFPIPVETEFTAESGWLQNGEEVGDCANNQIFWTSDYCLHNLQGQQYVCVSLNQIFQFCKKALGCGLSITPNGKSIRIESLKYYFQKDICILNLDNYQGVANMSIKPYIEDGGSNLKLGYAKADLNSDFGVDSFNTELYFNTPMTKKDNDIDLEIGDVTTDQYKIEKIRAQKVSQPIGQSYDPANPSNSNQNVVLYCGKFKIANHVGLPYDPSNYTYPAFSVYPVEQFDGVISSPAAQSNDSTATTAPYVYGMYYPDTAINLRLSPCRALKRSTGAFLHSVLDLMEDSYLTFRTTTVMQFNNKVLALSGIESNLVLGGANPVTTEFKDASIVSLPAKLFRPFLFTIETVAPVNMYSIMNDNPNGYIQFTWKNRIYKGFIMSISQMLAASSSTKFELLAHPDTTNDDLIYA